MFGVDGDPSVAKLNPDIVGMKPSTLAKNAGFSVPETTTIILAECKDVCVDECLTREKLSPVLAVVKAKDTEDGLKKAEASVLVILRQFTLQTKNLQNGSAIWFLPSALSGTLLLLLAALEMFTTHSFHL